MSFPDKMNEECGIFGTFSSVNIDTLSLTKYGLYALQHRGQEGAGIATLKENGKLRPKKGFGLVFDVFDKDDPTDEFVGVASIGHVLYSTAGGKGKSYNIQPMYEENEVKHTQVAIAHNGNLINTKELRKELIEEGFEFRSESSDTEVILKLLHKYQDLPLHERISKTCSRLIGAYSLLILTRNQLAVVRDPCGYRPLCLGKIPDSETYFFSSETCGLDAVDADFVRFVEPGETLIFTTGQEGFKKYKIGQKIKKKTCSFEYIYFARPDSIIDDIRVYAVREKMGEKLWNQMQIEADLVIGVPDSGVPAAHGYAQASNQVVKNVLIKNKYAGRSFISENDEIRNRVVKLKLNPIASEIKGKRVVVVDDSIVRGNTSRRIVDLIRKAGAKEIHFKSAAPKIMAPCFFGIDTPNKQELISANFSTEEIREKLQVDSLDFLSLDNLKSILDEYNFCYSCFTGVYDLPVEKYALTNGNI